jgi:quinol monooxygenase YgiN
VHFVLRQAQRAGDTVAREVRLLRAGPQGCPVGPRIDNGAGRASRLIEILLGGIPALASAPSDRRSCRGNEPEGMFMSRLMIVVEFEVKPEHRSAFVELMKGHAQRSRAEDGCQQFDVLVPQEDQSSVFLVEAWRDQAALDVHIKLPAMARLREAWQPWLVSMKATRCIAD